MWYWIIKVSILSFILIFLLHYLYSFFISTLTVPKVKDLVTLPQQKYDEMFHSLQQQQQQQQQQLLNSNGINNGNTATSSSSQSMKDDLINFLKDIGSSSTSNNTFSNTLSNTNVNENSNNLEYLPMNANTISSYSFNNN
jgi:hypothetical protein